MSLRHSLSFALSFGRLVSLLVTFWTPLALLTEKSPPSESLGLNRKVKSSQSETRALCQLRKMRIVFCRNSCVRLGCHRIFPLMRTVFVSDFHWKDAVALRDFHWSGLEVPPHLSTNAYRLCVGFSSPNGKPSTRTNFHPMQKTLCFLSEVLLMHAVFASAGSRD